MEDVEITIKDYVEASSEAAKRTRRIIVVLMIASVLMFSGLLSSLGSNWKFQRLRALEDVNGEYVKRRLGPPPQDSDSHSLYVARYNQLYSAALKDFVENAYTIRVPFFGIAIDINDLGPIGGVALVIIMVLFRTSITRELDNLRLSFKEAEADNQLNTLYYLLAMRQVLTFPNIDGKERSKFIETAPKMLILTPLLIYSLIVMSDLRTLNIIGYIPPIQMSFLIILELFLLIVVIVITKQSLIKLKQIDELWNYFWNILSEQNKVENDELPSPEPDA